VPIFVLSSTYRVPIGRELELNPGKAACTLQPTNCAATGFGSAFTVFGPRSSDDTMANNPFESVPVVYFAVPSHSTVIVIGSHGAAPPVTSTFPVNRSPARPCCFILSESRLMIVLGSAGCAVGFGAFVVEVPPPLAPPPGLVVWAADAPASASKAINAIANVIFIGSPPTGFYGRAPPRTFEHV